MMISIHKKQPFKGLCILVVEDSDVEKLIYLKILSRKYSVYTASDAKDGWKRYLELSPQIVFLDIGLPDGNGNDLARMMKEHNQTTHIIMATSNSDIENKKKAVLNRVDGFIVKPINTDRINDHIDQYLAKHRRPM
jgi:DNA-binding NtrC family response regulator